VDELALLITMDLEGHLYIEAIVPNNFVKEHDADTLEVRLPIPRSVAHKVGTAIIEAAAATTGSQSEKLN